MEYIHIYYFEDGRFIYYICNVLPLYAEHMRISLIIRGRGHVLINLAVSIYKSEIATICNCNMWTDNIIIIKCTGNNLCTGKSLK